MGQELSWVVTILGLIGFWLAGKKVWWCWYVNIANQGVWVAFALITGYYAFLIGTACYLFVFCRNAYLWTKEHFDKDLLNNVELVVKDYEEQVKFQGTYCGNVSLQHECACMLRMGHEGDHTFENYKWDDMNGVYSLRGKVVHEPPGTCLYSAIELPDGSTTGECRINHIHLNKNPLI